MRKPWSVPVRSLQPTPFSLTTYYIIEDKEILDRLVQESAKANPHSKKPLELLELEKLPYLNAVILDGLRVTYGVSHRSQRVCLEQAIYYHD